MRSVVGCTTASGTYCTNSACHTIGGTVAICCVNGGYHFTRQFSVAAITSFLVRQRQQKWDELRPPLGVKDRMGRF